MSAARSFHLRLPRLVGVLLGALLAIAAVLGATVMLALALLATVIGGLLRARRPVPQATRVEPGGRTIQVEYSVVGAPQRGGKVPDSGGLATKASNELS